MGCFGYICKGCGTPINGNALSGGEKCVMIHVRHGEEIGRIEGHYDEYGRVIEQEVLPENEKYRGFSDEANGHGAICDSEFALDDSYLRLLGMRLYNGQEIQHSQYIVAVKEELREIHGIEKAEILWQAIESNGALERAYAALPVPARECYSGTAAWHSLCYRLASQDAKANLTPSDNDPDQSWGLVRKKYK
jgi:hypothetical protein